MSDPQIITALHVSKLDSRCDSKSKYYRDMGLVFSNGNILSTHATFHTEHICNMFCNFFKIPSLCAGESLFTTHAHSNQQEECEIAEVSD